MARQQRLHLPGGPGRRANPAWPVVCRRFSGDQGQRADGKSTGGKAQEATTVITGDPQALATEGEHLALTTGQVRDGQVAFAYGSTFPMQPGLHRRNQDGIFVGQCAQVVTDGLGGHAHHNYLDTRQAQLTTGLAWTHFLDSLRTEPSAAAYVQENAAPAAALIHGMVQSLHTGYGVTLAAAARYADGLALLTLGDTAVRAFDAKANTLASHSGPSVRSGLGGGGDFPYDSLQVTVCGGSPAWWVLPRRNAVECVVS